MYVCMCVCVYECIYVYIYHTHTVYIDTFETDIWNYEIELAIMGHDKLTIVTPPL